jgi:hypothetical protein
MNVRQSTVAPMGSTQMLASPGTRRNPRAAV